MQARVVQISRLFLEEVLTCFTGISKLISRKILETLLQSATSLYIRTSFASLYIHCQIR